MEQVSAGPVKDRHEVIADNLNAKLGQVADALLVVFDILVAGRQADLDIVMDVHRFNNVAVEAVSVDLIHDFLDLVLFPNLTGHFVVQSPNDAGNAGNLLDVAEGDGVVVLTIPAPTHLHRHKCVPP